MPLLWLQVAEDDDTKNSNLWLTKKSKKCGRNARLEAEWNALPEEEQKRRREINDPAFVERRTVDINLSE